MKREDKRQTDLTRGSVVAGLIRFSVPTILASLLQALYGIADMVIAGRFLGDRALSSITNGGQPMTLLTFLAIGIAFGSNTLIAQYYGAGDAENRRRISETTLVLNFGLGTILAAVMCVLARPLMIAMKAPTLEEAVRYFRICAIGLIFIFGYNGLTAIIKAMGNARIPLVFVAVAAATNIILDCIFIAVFKMGVEGAAIATVAAQAVACAASLAYILRNDDLFLIRLRRLRFSLHESLTIIRIGLPSALQFLINGLSFMLLNRLMNDFGVTVSAAYGVSNKLKDLSILFVTSSMGSCAAMTAQCLGAGLPERAKRVVYSTCLFDVIVTGILILLFHVYAPALCALFTNAPETIDLAARMICIELIGMIGYCFFTPVHGLAIGSGRTGFVFLNGLLFIGLMQVVLGLALRQQMGYIGVNWSCVIAHFTPIPHCLWFFFSKRWKASCIGTDRKLQEQK